jgi:hypothetical protein
MTTSSSDDMAGALADLRARVAALEAAGLTNGAGSAPRSSPPSAASGKELEDAIDRMVAGALLNGRHTSGVLHGLFNISPGLSGR